MPASPGTYDYYLAPWVWNDTPEMQWWGAPVGMVASVDLRPIPAQAMAGGTPEGFGFFALDPAADAPGGSLYLGNDLNAALSDAVKRDAEERLNLSPGDFSLETLLDNGWLSLTNLADPTGDNRAKPLMPTVAGNLELHLAGHSLVKSERFDKVRHPWVKAIVQQNFGDRAAVDPNVMRLLRLKYGFTPQEIIGIRGGATAGDTFVESSDTDLSAHTATGPNGGFSWVETTGDLDVVAASDDLDVSTSGFARAESDLSSDDMRSEHDVLAITSARQSYAITRFDPTPGQGAGGEDFYFYILKNTSSDTHRLFKNESGTATQIGSTVNETPPTPTYTVRLESDGSNHTASLDTGSGFVVKIGPETDTAHDGIVRAGLGGSSPLTMDNFEAADLAAGATVPIFAHHYEAMRRR